MWLITSLATIIAAVILCAADRAEDQTVWCKPLLAVVAALVLIAAHQRYEARGTYGAALAPAFAAPALAAAAAFSPATVYYVCNAESCADASGQTSLRHSKLTEHGHWQAAEQADFLLHNAAPPLQVVTAPLQQAVETACIIAQNTDAGPIYALRALGALLRPGGRRGPEGLADLRSPEGCAVEPPRRRGALLRDWAREYAELDLNARTVFVVAHADRVRQLTGQDALSQGCITDADGDVLFRPPEPRVDAEQLYRECGRQACVERFGPEAAACLVDSREVEQENAFRSDECID